MQGIRKGGIAKSCHMLTVFNVTDGIPAIEETFLSVEGAEQAIRAFRKKYEMQGYYLTSTGQRIAPADIQLEIVSRDSD